MTISGRSMNGGIQVRDNITFKTPQGKQCCVIIFEEQLTASGRYAYYAKEGFERVVIVV